MTRFVIVGCGSAKRDPALEPGTLRPKRWEARELYTSTYFAKKFRYAEEIGDQQAILSAEHGLLYPWERIEPYDTSIDDLDDAELEGWADLVITELEEWTSWELSNGTDEIDVEILAGQSYLEPLRSTLDLIRGPITFSYPFDETSGIGDQLAWLTERIEAAETDGDRR